MCVCCVGPVGEEVPQVLPVGLLLSILPGEILLGQPTFLDCFDHSFLGLGLDKILPARESLVSDIPAGDGNTAKPFFAV